ncbi:MAG TPA: FAD-binding oxidoreductase [Tepidisphaeraceae bacterium]|jgi:hypothetical protein|nr:FAD-binding oxidoreductase [Tepidisphaeraceae bacterium]
MIGDGVFRKSRAPAVAPGAMELHRHDMTATFAADVTLGAAQERLAEIGQWLAVDGDPASSVGDLISFNSTGPLRLGYGAWRDLLLGVQFTNGPGELISAGGRTVKNVAGYDLTKFIVGSAGVFGKIVTATARTYRKPQCALFARFPADARRVGQLMPTSLRPQWAILTADALLCGYLGDERTINYYRTNLPQAEPTEIVERTVDQDIADRSARWRTHGRRTFRASVPPARIGDFVSVLPGGSWIADAAFGVVLGSDLREEQNSVVAQSAACVGGSVRFFFDDGGKKSIDFPAGAVERQIIGRLKKSFDPDEKLAPLPRSMN